MKSELGRQLRDLGGNPRVANAVSVIAGLFSLSLCMLLPLVGRAGNSVPYSDRNSSLFISIALTTLALAALSLFIKLKNRRAQQTAFPYFEALLVLVSIITILAYSTGLLST